MPLHRLLNEVFCTGVNRLLRVRARVGVRGIYGFGLIVVEQIRKWCLHT